MPPDDTDGLGDDLPGLHDDQLDDADLPGLDEIDSSTESDASTDAAETPDGDVFDALDKNLAEQGARFDAEAAASDQAHAELDEWRERAGETVTTYEWDRMSIERKAEIREEWEREAIRGLKYWPRWVFVGGGFGILGLVLTVGFFWFGGDADDPVVAPPGTEAVVEVTEAPVVVEVTEAPAVAEPATAAADVTVSVDPDSGPSGTTPTITVTGPANTSVTLEIGGAIITDHTDASGNLTISNTSIFGRVGDVIDIKATMGSGADAGTASTTFTITAPPDIFYFVSIGTTFDGAGHGPFVGMPNELQLQVRYGSITIEGPAPFVNVTGDVDADGAFSATGTGTVAGFSDISVTMVGSVTPGGLDAEYSMGTEGGLPTGQPITYRMVGAPIVAAPADGAADVEAFYKSLNQAQGAGDAAAMAELLHPAVFDLYGSDQCSTYLTGIANPAVVFNPIEVLDFGAWQWERDGVITLVDDAFTVMVNATVNGEDQGNVEAHIAYNGDDLAWFTDCGEPLPG